MTDRARWEELTCPFCKEGDFDHVGLKNHLLRGWCDQFSAITDTNPTPTGDAQP